MHVQISISSMMAIIIARIAYFAAYSKPLEPSSNANHSNGRFQLTLTDSQEHVSNESETETSIGF